MEQAVQQVFKDNYGRYGARRIQKVLIASGFTVSRRRITKIMHKYGLMCKFTKRRSSKANTKLPVNYAPIKNLVKREFTNRNPLEVLVCDLTYVWLGSKWAYICPIIDLWNREIVSFAISVNKDANLVQEAIYRIPYNLDNVSIFHTDRGGEFCNHAIDQILKNNNIQRSLSKGGTPLDNAVIESTNRTLKTECLNDYKFTNLNDLKLIFGDYVHWYNNHRLHSTLNYQTPMQLRKQQLVN